MDRDSFLGMETVGPEGFHRMLLPTADHEAVNSTSGDVVPSMLNCRYIYSDAAGIVKFDYTKPDGSTGTEIMQVAAATLYPIRNVVKVYRYYKDTTAITAQSYTSAGALANGLKLRR